MLNLEDIAVDPKKAEGTWVKYLGGQFKLARYSNTQAEAARSQAMLAFYDKFTDKDDGYVASKEDQAELIKANIKAFCEHVLLDWKGVGRSGVEVKYTPEEGFAILSNPAYPDLYPALVKEALKFSNFAATVEAKVKKQVKSSASS